MGNQLNLAVIAGLYGDFCERVKTNIAWLKDCL